MLPKSPFRLDLEKIEASIVDTADQIERHAGHVCNRDCCMSGNCKHVTDMRLESYVRERRTLLEQDLSAP